MLFNSIPFIFVYFPIVVVVFFLLGRLSRLLAGIWLCGASLFFYGWWDYHYIGLLIASVLFNFSAGYALSKQPLNGNVPTRLSYGILFFAVCGNLALLGYFKYAQFFVITMDHLTGGRWAIDQIILPLGISFFTFTQIAFLVDTYRGKVRELSFVHYLLFVTYFPHLIAGPILHHAQMMPQFALQRTYRLNPRNVAIGVTFFALGLGKKTLLADTFSTTATTIFQACANGISPMMAEAWIGALFYTLQLYFDFSGYTDMAIGISYFFNIRLPLNFNSPYKATSIVDFWRRWHMTLSAFLRDYLYIPLGGNRCGDVRRYVNLMLTMLLGGLWHGAGWTFVIWGGLHGLYLCVNHGFQAFRQKIGWEDGRLGWFGHLSSVTITFLSVVVAWVFFRAANFSVADKMIKGMFGFNGLSLTNSSGNLSPALVEFLQAHGVVFLGFTPITLFTGLSLCKLAVGLAIIWLLPNSQEWMAVSMQSPSHAKSRGLLKVWQPESTWTCLAVGVILAISILTMLSGAPSEFLYFQF